MSDSDASVLLEETFVLLPYTDSVHKVVVTKKGISYEPCVPGVKRGGKSGFLAVKDIIGCKIGQFGDVAASGCCRCKKARISNVSECYLSVFACPMVSRRLGGDRRKKLTLTFVVSKHSEYDGNHRVCQKWRTVLLRLSQNLNVSKEGIHSRCDTFATSYVFSISLSFTIFCNLYYGQQ